VDSLGGARAVCLPPAVVFRYVSTERSGSQQLARTLKNPHVESDNRILTADDQGGQKDSVFVVGRRRCFSSLLQRIRAVHR